MNLKSVGLVLEGGGMRGVYTAGVLRFFMDQHLYLPYVIGVSMGACNGANYVARQPERNRIVNIRYVKDTRFISYGRLLLGGELFGMRFIFNTIPRRLVPFDFETFQNSSQRFIVTATDCETGQAVYYEKQMRGDDLLHVLQAGCSLPLIQKPVRYDGRLLMDGGIADSVPIRKSIHDGNQRHVLVLTRPKGYRKKRSRMENLIRLRYRKYPGLCKAFAHRATGYNETMEFIDRLEDQKGVFVIRPSQSLAVGRTERNPEKLYAVYDQGYEDAKACYGALCAYLDAGATF